MTKVLGSSDYVTTSVKDEIGDRSAKIVEIEGLFSYLSNNRTSLVDEARPSGYAVETSNLASTQDGMGKITVRCVKYETASSFSAVRTTFRIDMIECQYDLKDHPHLQDERASIKMWLATAESKRSSGGSFFFEIASGELIKVGDDHPLTYKFCRAYDAGITTFNRYFPVIEKISIYKNPPGMLRNDRSFTGGSPTFSSDIGHFDAPPLSLNGYPKTKWFKSKDSWIENDDRTWTRTEQWTYAPTTSSDEKAWIYNTL